MTRSSWSILAVASALVACSGAELDVTPSALEAEAARCEVTRLHPSDADCSTPTSSPALAVFAHDASELSRSAFEIAAQTLLVCRQLGATLAAPVPAGVDPSSAAASELGDAIRAECALVAEHVSRSWPEARAVPHVGSCARLARETCGREESIRRCNVHVELSGLPLDVREHAALLLFHIPERLEEARRLQAELASAPPLPRDTLCDRVAARSGTELASEAATLLAAAADGAAAFASALR